MSHRPRRPSNGIRHSECLPGWRMKHTSRVQNADRFLHGRVAIVTGGASGIGRAIALRLARAGADVCILSLNRDRANVLPGELKYFATSNEMAETCAEVEAAGGRCLAIEGDVGRAEDVAGTVSTVLDRLGGVH